MKKMLKNAVRIGAIAGGAIAGYASTPVQIYLTPEQRELTPGQIGCLDVIIDNTPLTSDSALTQGEKTTVGVDMSVEMPAGISYIRTEFPANGEDFYSGLDMLAGYNFLGNVVGNRVDGTRVADFFTHNERDSKDYLTYGALGKSGLFEKIYFQVNSNTPIGYNESFSINWDHTVLSNGAAEGQNFMVNSQSFSVVESTPESGTLALLGLGGAALLRRRKTKSQ
jgi:hypothetical protein